MEKYPKVSVVIPFYNGKEALFFKCIDSVLGQTYSNIEIVIVNDGSSSKYDDLLLTVQKKDARIVVVNQQNQGVSVARNTGVKNSSGDFVAFVDADDFLDCEYLSDAVRIQQENDADFVIGGVLSVDENKLNDIKQSSNEQSAVVQIYEKNSFDKIIPSLISSQSIIRFSDGGYINRGPVARLLKKEIAKNILFPEGIPLGEDIIWNQYVLKKCNRIAIVKKVWYYYVQNTSSASHAFRKNAVEEIRLECVALFDAIDETNDDVYRSFCNRLLGDTKLHICRFYLTKSENKEGFWKNLKIYSNLKKMEPWTHISWRFVKIGNFREKMEAFLFWSNAYFVVAYIKDHLNCRGG